MSLCTLYIVYDCKICIELVEELDWLKSVSSQVMEEQSNLSFQIIEVKRRVVFEVKRSKDNYWGQGGWIWMVLHSKAASLVVQREESFHGQWFINCKPAQYQDFFIYKVYKVIYNLWAGIA